jgi:hypothetical protein
MQADGKGIALRPEHRKEPGPDTAQPGIKKMAEVVAVADFTPAVRVPQDIAAPQARRKEHPSPGQVGIRLHHRQHRGDLRVHVTVPAGRREHRVRGLPVTLAELHECPCHRLDQLVQPDRGADLGRAEHAEPGHPWSSAGSVRRTPSPTTVTAPPTVTRLTSSGVPKAVMVIWLGLPANRPWASETGTPSRIRRCRNR